MSAALTLAGALGAVGLDRFDGRDLSWCLVGHGPRRVGCGFTRKVGTLHQAGSVRKDGSVRETESYCVWDEPTVHHNADDPECFNQPGGYADREAKGATARIEFYFEVRNEVRARAHAGRSAARWARSAKRLRDLTRRLEVRWGVSQRRMWDLAKRYRTYAERDAGRSRVRRPVHVVVAPPPSRWREVHRSKWYVSLRTEAYAHALARGVDGGVAVFHHARLRASRWEGNRERFGDDGSNCAVEGPHWHIIGDAWVTQLDRCDSIWCHPTKGGGYDFGTVPDEWATFGRGRCPKWHEGVDWVVRNLGIRRSVYGTLFYVLTHASVSSRLDPARGPEEAGILPQSEPAPPSEDDRCAAEAGRFDAPRPSRRPHQTVTWFGSLSYRAFPVEVVSPGGGICPVCEGPVGPGGVVEVEPNGPGPPRSGSFEADAGEWRAKVPGRFADAERLLGRLAPLTPEQLETSRRSQDVADEEEERTAILEAQLRVEGYRLWEDRNTWASPAAPPLRRRKSRLETRRSVNEAIIEERERPR